MVNKKEKKEKVIIPDFSGGKMAPQALEFEAAVLGAAMIERGAAAKMMTIVDSTDFFSERHELIYKAIKDLEASHSPIDIITVTQQARKNEDLEMIGGAIYITSLTNNVVSGANIEYWASIIKQKSILRNLIRELHVGITKAYDEAADAFSLPKEIAYSIENETSYNNPDMRSIGDIAKELKKNMELAEQNDKELLGPPSSLKAVNALTMGYCAPDLYILAGSAGEGKTTFALQDAIHQAKEGHPTAFFSMEMKALQLARKMLSSEIGATIKEIKKAKSLTPDQWAKTYDFVKSAESIPFYIYDVSGLTIQNLVGQIKEAKRKYNIEVAYVDYLQLLSGGKEFKGIREQEVSLISRELKQATMKIGIPIVALAQVSRPERSAKPRIYTNRDLRESGAIEQNADVVMFVFSPSYHGMKRLREGDPDFLPEDMFIVIGKHREGETGLIPCKFYKKFGRFVDVEEVESIDDIANEIYQKQISEEQNENEDLPF